MLYKYGKRTRDFLGRFYFYFSLLLYKSEAFLINKTIIPLALVGYDMIIANSALGDLLAIFYLICNGCLWNTC